MTDLINYVDVRVHFSFDSVNNCLIIKEDDILSKINKVLITGSQYVFKGFKLDCKKTGCLSKYISKNIPGIRDACDCVLLVKSDTWSGVVFIELKSNDFKKIDLENKFKSAKAFTNYIRELYNSFSDSPVVNHNYQYVLFSTKPIAGSNPKRPINVNLNDGTVVKRFHILESKKEGKFDISQLIKT